MLLATACRPPGEQPAAGPEPPRPRLAVRFEVESNPGPGDPALRTALTLTNVGGEPLPPSGWTLFFNFTRTLETAGDPGLVSVRHVNGDFWRLEPGSAFTALAPGERRRLALSGRGAVARRSDAPAGLYFAWTGDARPPGPPPAVADYVVAPLASPEQTRRGPDDVLPVPTAASRWSANRTVEPLPTERVGRLVPTPAAIVEGTGSVTIDAGWTIVHQAGLEAEARHLAARLGERLGESPAVRPGEARRPASIALAVGEIAVSGRRRGPGDEAYHLSVTPGAGVRIVGSDAAGVFYATQSLLALLPLDGVALVPELRLEDAPRFPYRGLHLDVARNFQTPETVARLLDLMAFYKLNRFHFHLSDDEGWRLPVEALPELTGIGGRRGHTLDESDRLVPSFGSGPDPDRLHGSGHYSRAQLVELLRRARDRHIRVIPEIDLPGHARAAVRAMEARSARLLAAGGAEEAAAHRLQHPEDASTYRSVQGWDDNVVDVCLESTYSFVATVVDAIVDLWQEAEAPLEVIHLGGDEVPHGAWRASPACRELIAADPALGGVGDLPGYFLRRAAAILDARGLALGGWEEIALVEEGVGSRRRKRPHPEFATRGFRPWVWNNVWGWGAEDVGYRLANAGYEIVLANATNLYFDLAYEKHPDEPGLDWAGFVDTRTAWELVPLDLFRNARIDRLGRPIDPRSLASRERLGRGARRRVLGVQGQLWGENARSRERLDYFALPKLLGLAERAWARRPEWARLPPGAAADELEAQAWSEFANRLGRRELPRLDRLFGGFAYRLPPPGAIVDGGVLHANVAFPGLAIRYRDDGGDPAADSPLYTAPVAVAGAVRLRSFDSRGRGSRVTLAR